MAGEFDSFFWQKQEEIQDANDKRAKVEGDFELFVQQKEEESFKMMETSRWIDAEGSSVIAGLDKLKRDMRDLAKGAATKEPFFFKRLAETDYNAFMRALDNVCVLTGEDLPNDLISSKSMALLLNALLAHDVFTIFFRHSFLFLAEDFHNGSRVNLSLSLNEIYSHIGTGMYTSTFARNLIKRLSEETQLPR
jgi:hypothetical protein